MSVGKLFEPEASWLISRWFFWLFAALLGMDLR
jgi:hypothetical protein